MCPKACGCSSALSGQMWSEASQGCPQKCTEVRAAELAELPCVDSAPSEPMFQVYVRGQRIMAEGMNDDMYMMAIDMLKLQGCPGLTEFGTLGEVHLFYKAYMCAKTWRTYCPI